MKKKLAILHYLPIEGYPPVVNLMEYTHRNGSINLLCLTTKGYHGHKISNNYGKIIRLGQISRSGFIGKLGLYFSYILYNMGGLFILLFYRPEVILYYETISSFPGLVYKWLFPKTHLMVHYHEYTTPEEYHNGMKLVRWFHRLEINFYSRVSWLSHTNEYRLNLFQKDLKEIKFSPGILRIMPNYPSKRWSKAAQFHKKEFKFPIKLVYIGSFASFDTLYIKELAEWLKKHPHEFTLDIFSFHIPKIIKEYCNIQNIKINGNINYSEIPQIIPKYDVGLIIYKGVTPNFKYNAPNKLFEYQSCGLDVWYPDKMIGINPYTKWDTFPKVIPVDFSNLEKFNWKDAISRKDIEFSLPNFNYENVYSKLLDKIL